MTGEKGKDTYGCIAWAKENNVTLIDDEHVKIINDKRKQEKEKK